MSALGEIAAFASSLRIDDLAPTLVDKAKTCILDAMFGNFLVASDSRAQAALRAVPLDGPECHASVVGSRHLAAPADAAFVNATSSAATDRSDTHPPTATHPGLMTVPGALALAQQRQRDGASLIVGIIAGYETMCRLARALVTPELAAVFRPTALVGPTAAAIAAARTLGLPTEQIVAAASLATQTAAGFNEWAHAGTTEHPFHAAFAARNAVTATLLAESGVTAAPTVLEGKAGMLAGFGALQRSAELTRGLGHAFEMLDIVHKPAPACFFVQAPCQLAKGLARRGAYDIAEIERIEIGVTAAAFRYPGCNNSGPMEAQQSAIMSLQFSVASVLAAGGIFDANWRDFRDPSVNALAHRTTVIADDVLTAAYPARQGVYIRITLRDGRTLDAAQDDFRSMTHDEVVARFLDFATPQLGAARAAEIVARIGQLEQLSDVRVLSRLLRTG